METTKAKPALPDTLRFGVISDLHHGLFPQAMGRLEAFLDAMARQNVDFIIQLGDFNYAKEESRECLDLWESFDGPKYHVLGNHDMDFKTKEEVVALWSMPASFYSFDIGGFHFVVLDRNNLNVDGRFEPYSKGNYYVDQSKRGWADPVQLEWLQEDLSRANKPSVIFVHQGLGMEPIENPVEGPRGQIQAVLEAANRQAGQTRVIACFSGHHHIDRHNLLNGIHYTWINSASYYWVGEGYGQMAPYKDSLFATVTLRTGGLIDIEGRRSSWEAPSPEERSFPGADELTPYISDRHLKYSISPKGMESRLNRRTGMGSANIIRGKA